MSDENPKPPRDQRPPGGGDPQLNWRGLVLFAIALLLIGGAFLFPKGGFTQPETLTNKQFLDLVKAEKIVITDEKPLEIVVDEGLKTQAIVGVFKKNRRRPTKKSTRHSAPRSTSPTMASRSMPRWRRRGSPPRSSRTPTKSTPSLSAFSPSPCSLSCSISSSARKSRWRDAAR